MLILPWHGYVAVRHLIKPSNKMRPVELRILTVPLLWSLASTLLAQQNPCLNRTLAVNVTTQDGHLVIGLTPSNFRAEFRGKPVAISSVAYDTAPRRVVILLDTSGSMVREDNKWTPALILAEDLVTAAPLSVQLAFLAFSSQVEERVDFTQSRKEVGDELLRLRATHWDELKGYRKTALLDAIATALLMLKPTHQGDAIYMVTDAGENASQGKKDRLEQLLLSSGVRVFGFFPLRSCRNACAPRKKAISE